MLWVKAFHIIAVICWFAALFYLPRLFVHHAMTEDQATRERFKIMERKLYRGIMTPAMIATLALGIWMLAQWFPGYLKSGWMHVKLTGVVILVGYHHMCARYLKQFANDANTRSHKFYRLFNEIPTVLLLLIVIMVVVKPF